MNRKIIYIITLVLFFTTGFFQTNGYSFVIKGHNRVDEVFTVNELKLFMTGNLYRFIVIGVCEPSLISNSSSLNLYECEMERNGFDQDLAADSIVKQSLKVFPNPVSTEATIHLAFPANGDYDFEVHNLIGNLVEKGKIFTNARSFILGTSKYPNGLYIITMQKDGKEPLITKLLVSH